MLRATGKSSTAVHTIAQLLIPTSLVDTPLDRRRRRNMTTEPAVRKLQGKQMQMNGTHRASPSAGRADFRKAGTSLGVGHKARSNLGVSGRSGSNRAFFQPSIIGLVWFESSIKGGEVVWKT